MLEMRWRAWRLGRRTVRARCSRRTSAARARCTVWRSVAAWPSVFQAGSLRPAWFRRPAPDGRRSVALPRTDRRRRRRRTGECRRGSRPTTETGRRRPAAGWPTRLRVATTSGLTMGVVSAGVGWLGGGLPPPSPQTLDHGQYFALIPFKRNRIWCI